MSMLTVQMSWYIDLFENIVLEEVKKALHIFD